MARAPITSRKEPQNIFGLGVECVKNPSRVGDLALSGVSNSRLLWQLMVGYLLALLLSGLAAGIEVEDGFVFQLPGFLAGVVGLLGNLLILALAFYILSLITGSGATFLGLLTGLAFLQLLLATIFLLTAVTLDWPAGLVSEGTANTLASIHWLANFVLVIMLYGAFVMGAFDVGCGLAVGMAILVSIVVLWIRVAIVAGVLAMMGT